MAKNGKPGDGHRNGAARHPHPLIDDSNLSSLFVPQRWHRTIFDEDKSQLWRRPGYLRRNMSARPCICEYSRCFTLIQRVSGA